MPKEAMDEIEDSDTIELTIKACESLRSFVFLDLPNSNAKYKSIPGKIEGFFFYNLKIIA